MPKPTKTKIPKPTRTAATTSTPTATYTQAPTDTPTFTATFHRHAGSYAHSRSYNSAYAVRCGYACAHSGRYCYLYARADGNFGNHRSDGDTYGLSYTDSDECANFDRHSGAIRALGGFVRFC